MPTTATMSVKPHQGFGVCQYGERRSVGNAELAINTVQVDLHGPLSHAQPPPDFLVGYSLGEHEHELALASRECVMCTIS